MTMIPRYNTMTYTDIWETPEAFYADFQNSFASNSISVESSRVLANLLYAQYGNSPIANRDVNQFKAKVWSVIYSYGPAWEKRLDIQKKLIGLNEEDIRLGSKSINNIAQNPTQLATTAGLNEVVEITQQSSQGFTKSKLDAYAQLYELIVTDVTTEFIDKFKHCFKTLVLPENPILYVDDEDEEE